MTIAMHRRDFIQKSASCLALPAAVSCTAVSARAADAPADIGAGKRVALIGSGWYGKCDLLRLVQVAPVNVVALCDVDRQMLDKAAPLVASRQVSKKEPRKYRDYRKLLEKEAPEIVLIATPDHWHALPMIDAVKAGADVYVQKPISVDVVEGQAMLAAARKYKRVVQVGTQRRSTPHLIEARDKIIRTGRLGKIAHAEVYCYYHMRTRGKHPAETPPDHLDYDMWTGPAPMRPYTKVVHPRRWRGFMEYSNGIVGDMCIHMYDTVRWMLELGWPLRVSSAGGIQVDKESIATISDTQNAVFDHGDLQVIWQHRTWGHSVDKDYPWGATIYGDRGTLKLSVHRYDFIPHRGSGKAVQQKAKFELEEYPEDKTEEGLEKHVAPAIRVHMRDFLKCIGDRGRPVADIEQGFISSTACILANMAMQVGRTLDWDAKNGRIRNDPEANRLLKRPYRAPWIHPDPKNV